MGRNDTKDARWDGVRQLVGQRTLPLSRSYGYLGLEFTLHLRTSDLPDTSQWKFPCGEHQSAWYDPWHHSVDPRRQSISRRGHQRWIR
jgi:hypothetical protein